MSNAIRRISGLRKRARTRNSSSRSIQAFETTWNKKRENVRFNLLISRFLFGKWTPEPDERLNKKALRNQFNFQERSAMTFNLPLREKGMKTEPPQMTVLQIETTQWMIFDAYMNQYEELNKEDDTQKKKGSEKPQT